MMIVRTDTVSEKIVAKDLSDTEALKQCEVLNANQHLTSPDFYEVKPDDYVPYEWKP